MAEADKSFLIVSSFAVQLFEIIEKVTHFKANLFNNYNMLHK